MIRLAAQPRRNNRVLRVQHRFAHPMQSDSGPARYRLLVTLLSMQDRVTLEDIGRELGLSKATVSRAITGHPRVAESTRQRVQETAERMGYRPDAALTALAQRRWPGGRKASTSQIQYIHNLSRDMPDRLGFLEREASHLGYQLRIDHFKDIDDPKAYTQNVIDRGIRGVIFHAVDDESSVRLPIHDLAGVVMGFGFPGTPLPRVTPDLRGNFNMCVRQARRRGYRRIGFVLRRHSNKLLNRILTEEAQTRHRELENNLGEQPPILWVTKNYGTGELAEWFQTHQPEVIITDRRKLLNDTKELGLSCPSDVGLMNFFPGMVVPRNDPITCVNMRPVMVFRQALHLLHQRLLAEEWGRPNVRLRVLIGGKWREGRTARPAQQN